MRAAAQAVGGASITPFQSVILSQTGEYIIPLSGLDAEAGSNKWLLFVTQQLSLGTGIDYVRWGGSSGADFDQVFLDTAPYSIVKVYVYPLASAQASETVAYSIGSNTINAGSFWILEKEAATVNDLVEDSLRGFTVDSVIGGCALCIQNLYIDNGRNALNPRDYGLVNGNHYLAIAHKNFDSAGSYTFTYDGNGGDPSSEAISCVRF
jgi:hypothetical protein